MLDKIIAMCGGREDMMMLLTDAVKLISLFVASFGVILAYSYYAQMKQELSIYEIPKQVKERKNYITDVLFKELTSNLKILEIERGKKEGWSKNMSMAIVGAVLAFAIFLLLNGQLFIGIIFPAIMLIILTKIIGLISVSLSEKLRMQMPYAIDSVIRALSKNDDLKSVLYDASAVLEEPLKSMFSEMSIRMMQVSPDAVLKEFMEEQKNIWVYAFAFTLQNYLEETSKEDTILQLRELKSVIDKENKDKSANKAEKKMTVAINYVLCAFAVIGFFANLAMNPIGKTFFFSSVIGMVCFIVGIILVIVSIFSNLLLGSGKL